jgi:hypothetical protein
MIVATLARKPLRGTILDNIMLYGVGALNINDCRIGTDPIVVQGGGGAAWDTDGNKVGRPMGEINEARIGRFPANLVLVHQEGCTRAGIAKVKGSGHWISAGDSKGVVWGKGFHQEQSDFGNVLADSEGLETVDVWVCTVGCPVPEMDQQSGVSRFFKQVKGD